MRKSKTTFFIIFAVVVFGIVLLGYRNFLPSNESGPLANIPCNNAAIADPEGLHIHPEIKIVINSESFPIPANLGLSFICERVLHTHEDKLTPDGARLIHVEPDFPYDFVLADFFAVWEKPFSATSVLDYAVDSTHEIAMTVDGAPSTEYERLVLKDKQKIVIEYRPKVGGQKTSMLTEEQALAILHDYLKKEKREYTTIKLSRGTWFGKEMPNAYIFDLLPSMNDMAAGTPDGALVDKTTGKVEISITAQE